ncbi:MAG: carboxymuconolactone decarboxylase family protein, partial [Flavobacteriales bacterium]|nr:carboxymuconolactone decarboxylase family protein [Flavobacteriales bacterium]
MAHIALKNEQLPGIIGLMHFRPETAVPLNALVETLLRGPNSLTPGEREIIASSVSWWNDCHFCHTTHGAAAAAHHGGDLGLIDEIKAGLPDREVSPKLRALLTIARRVQQGGKQVTKAEITAARDAGATDVEIHDAVLIAAAFCMFNRYVDGLGTWSPEPKEAYKEVGEM